MKKESKLAYISATLYAFIIGLSFLFVKITLSITTPLDILAHRFTVSIIFASIPMIFGWVKLDIKVKDIINIIPVALFYPVIFFTFQALGLVYISSSEAGIIQATLPIFTMVLSRFILKENCSRFQKSFLFLSTLGVIYIFFMKGTSFNVSSLKGCLLILLSTISSAIYNILARKTTRKYKPLDLTYMITFVGFISFNFLNITNHIISGTVSTYFNPLTNSMFLVSILYLGLLSSLIASLLSNYSLSKIGAAEVSVFSNFATLITVISGIIFLNEKLEYFHILGGLIILVGVIGTNLYAIRDKKM